MNGSVSIRRSLLSNLIVMLVLLSVAIQGTMILAARRVVRTLSASLIEQTLDQTEAQLQRFFDPVVSGMQFARSWGEAGLLSDEETIDLDGEQLHAADIFGTLNDQLVPLMHEYQQISSLLVADERGREHMVLRVGDAWTVRKTRRGQWGDESLLVNWSNDEPEPRMSTARLGYDPRVRPWFKGAVDADRKLVDEQPVNADDHAIFWTEPYTFFTTKEPGITASTTFDPGDGLVHVVGFDVLLNDITTFTTGLAPTENGAAFVMDQDGRLIGLPRHERFDDPQARAEAMLKRPAELGIPAATDGVRAYRERSEGAPPVYRYRSERKAWWAGLRPFQLNRERELMIVVAVPESDLLGGLSQMRLWIILITVGVLAGAIVRAVMLAGRYSRPIEALVRQSDRISRGDLEPGEPVDTPVREVRQLAEAHDRMRQGLRTLMKLERDIQLARQIQQRTFPDRLPVLGGYEIDAWSEPADETGGDTYDVIGYTYDVIEYEHARPGRRGARLTHRADRAMFLLADATGHGIGPALSVTQIRAMLRMAVRMGEDLLTIVRHLNDQLCADLSDARFITAWLGELNGRDHTLTSFSAGQAPLLRYDAARDEVEVLNADMPPFGVLDDLEIQLPDPIVMNPGDIFAVISDGVFEAVNDDNEQFGLARVVEVLSLHHRRSPAQILSSVRETLTQFTGGAPAADDRTAIILKRAGR
ncbi:MAG: SpoIIE family protein phosphatase [Phycisphaerales bacterium]